MEFEDITNYEPDEELYHYIGAVCPYCGYINKPDGTEEEFYVEDVYKYKCTHCDKEFKMVTQISYSYYTSKLEEGLV